MGLYQLFFRDFKTQNYIESLLFPDFRKAPRELQARIKSCDQTFGQIGFRILQMHLKKLARWNGRNHYVIRWLFNITFDVLTIGLFQYGDFVSNIIFGFNYWFVINIPLFFNYFETFLYDDSFNSNIFHFLITVLF